MLLRSGIDLVEINRFEALNPAIRERFLQRVFTENEIRDSGTSIASLAGRFAAKEAVAKALGCGIGPVAWREIEILQGEHGEPLLKLHGKALELAQQTGLHTWSISITHTTSVAAASAVAIGLTESPPGAVTG